MLERFPELIKLSTDEKLQLVEELWNDIADHHADEIPIPKEVMEEVERRHAAYLQNPDSGSSWEEVQERILSRYARQPGNST